MVAPSSPPPLPHPQTAPPMPSLRPAVGIRVLWLSLLITFCALAMLGLVAFLGWKLGPVALGVGIAGAILPVPVLVACFLWLDRYEPSPLWILVLTFLWG